MNFKRGRYFKFVVNVLGLSIPTRELTILFNCNLLKPLFYLGKANRKTTNRKDQCEQTNFQKDERQENLTITINQETRGMTRLFSNAWVSTYPS